MSFRARMSISHLALCVAALAVALLIWSPGGADPAESPTAAEDAGAQGEQAACLVQHFDKAEEIRYPWGWIRWLMNAKTDPRAEMTFGIVHVNPNVRNPGHVHPNCAEYLHVLSGSCEHLVGSEWVSLKQGDTVRIPAGVPHMARTRDEPLRAVIVYSSGDRQFELVEEAESE